MVNKSAEEGMRTVYAGNSGQTSLAGVEAVVEGISGEDLDVTLKA